MKVPSLADWIKTVDSSEERMADAGKVGVYRLVDGSQLAQTSSLVVREDMLPYGAKEPAEFVDDEVNH